MRYFMMLNIKQWRYSFDGEYIQYIYIGGVLKRGGKIIRFLLLLLFNQTKTYVPVTFSWLNKHDLHYKK